MAVIVWLGGGKSVKCRSKSLKDSVSEMPSDSLSASRTFFFSDQAFAERRRRSQTLLFGRDLQAGVVSHRPVVTSRRQTIVHFIIRQFLDVAKGAKGECCAPSFANRVQTSGGRFSRHSLAFLTIQHAYLRCRMFVGACATAKVPSPRLVAAANEAPVSCGPLPRKIAAVVLSAPVVGTEVEAQPRSLGDQAGLVAMK